MNMGEQIAAYAAARAAADAANGTVTAPARICMPCKSPGASGSCWCEESCGSASCGAGAQYDRPGDVHLAFPVPRFKEA